MPALPVFALFLTIALAILWVVGEALDKAWLRRTAGPFFVVAVAGIAMLGTAITTSFDDSLRYSGAMKRFVTALLETSEREGDEAAVRQLRRFDEVSTETYEGGALLTWLAEPVDSQIEPNDGE